MIIDRDIRIPLRDGITVAGTLYRPDDANPLPATLIFAPYRKDDLNAIEDEFQTEYFAQQGYASLQVDMRGCGASEGERWESFDGTTEGQDGFDVVEWIAAQEWCDGNVAMYGFSYPGCTSLQTAVLAPPHLKAIAPIMPPADAYELWYPSDVPAPYISSTWAGFMFALELLPPGRQDAEGKWYETWCNRLDRFGERSHEWRRHPDRKDPYWDVRRIDPARITVPTFMIGGWRDLFPREVVATYEGLAGPRKMLVGPWEHCLPNAFPKAPVDHLELIRRWFDQWLKGVNSGAPGEDDPEVAYYTYGAEQWRGGDNWPIAPLEDRVVYLSADHKLVDDPSSVADGEIQYLGDPTVGAQSVLLDGLGGGLAEALDQGPDDVASLTFTAAVVESAFELTGIATARLAIALDEGEELDLTVKLSHVAPNGASTLITLGSARLEPGATGSTGEFSDIDIPLLPIAYEVPAGHALRVAVACGDFPRHWPSLRAPRIRLATGGANPSMLILPVLPAADRPQPALPSPDPSINTMPLFIDGTVDRRVERSVVGNSVKTLIDGQSTARLPGAPGVMKIDQSFRFTVAKDRPAAAQVETDCTIVLPLDNGAEVKIHALTWQTRQAHWGTAQVSLNGKPFFERSFRN